MADELTEQDQTDVISDDDQEMLNELDLILGEAEAVDGGTVTESGEFVEMDDTPQIQTSELLLPIISSCFDIFAAKWKVSTKEKKALAGAYGDLLDKYFPDAGSYFGVELTALTVTGMVVAPRLMASSDEKDVTPSKEEKPNKEPSGFEVTPEYDYKPTPQEIGGFQLD